jgi:hypothetical protein
VSTDLSGRAELPRRIGGEAEDIIIVLKHEVLGVALLVQDHTDSGRVVDDPTALRVPQVVSSVVASIAVDVLKL